MQYCFLQYPSLLSPTDIHNPVSFLLWTTHFILSGAISNYPPLFLSSILDTFWSRRLIFWCHLFSFLPRTSPGKNIGVGCYVFSELFIMTCLSWMILHALAHSWVMQAPSPWQGCDPCCCTQTFRIYPSFSWKFVPLNLCLLLYFSPIGSLKPYCYSLAVWVWLFNIPHISEIMKYFSLWIWHISLSIKSPRVIPVVPNGRIFFFLWLKIFHPLPLFIFYWSICDLQYYICFRYTI